MLERLSKLENVVAITGDIHAFHAATPMVNDDPERKIVEFVASSISSATFSEELNAVVENNPALADFDEAKQLVEIADFLLNSPDLRTNPHLPWSDSTRHGFVIVDLDAEHFEATYHRIAQDQVRTDASEDLEALLAAYEIERFRVNAGAPELHRRMSGEWRRWNPSTYEWE
jgi:alkaline phosphatase D